MKPAPITLLTFLAVVILTVDFAQAAEPEMPHPELRVQAKILRRGDFIAFGFGSVWMMSGNRLGRFDPADNSAIDIPVEGALGP